MAGPNLGSMAWRNLWRNGRRTFLTLISIAFGTFLAILFTSMQDRNWSEMIDVAARLYGGHVTVQHEEYADTPTLSRTVPGAAALAREAEELPHVRKATARIVGHMMLSSTTNSLGAMLVAYDPAAEDESTLSVLEAVQGGAAFESADDKGILLGKRLAKNLDVEEGDKVVYTMMDRDGEIVRGLARMSGTVATGADSLDGTFALLAIDPVREALGYGPDEATQVAIFVDDNRRASAVAQAISPRLTGTDSALTWDVAQPELSSFIAMKVGGAIVMEVIIIMLVSAGIFNTLFVSVMERSREFGIMLAIGFSPRQLFGLVVWESLLLGVVGVVLGLAVTSWPYYYLSTHGLDLSAATAGQDMEIAGVGMSSILYVGIFPEHLLIILAGVISATMLAGLYPAWRAGRVNPVESIYLV